MNRLGIGFSFLARPPKRKQLCGLVCLAFVAGCIGRVDAPVNVNVAQKILTMSMESWKDGKLPKDLLVGSPSVFVQEAEWNDETQLLGFEIINDEQSAGPNLIATVKLKLSDSEGKVVEKTATYIVGTSPSLVVYRNLMR
jgi:hypothetical protein